MDTDVEQRFCGAAHQLALSMGFALKVQATYRAGLRAPGFIILREMIFADMQRDYIGAESFGKIDTFVVYVAGDDKDQVNDIIGLDVLTPPSICVSSGCSARPIPR